MRGRLGPPTPGCRPSPRQAQAQNCTLDHDQVAAVAALLPPCLIRRLLAGTGSTTSTAPITSSHNWAESKPQLPPSASRRLQLITQPSTTTTAAAPSGSCGSFTPASTARQKPRASSRRRCRLTSPLKRTRCWLRATLASLSPALTSRCASPAATVLAPHAAQPSTSSVFEDSARIEAAFRKYCKALQALTYVHIIVF